MLQGLRSNKLLYRFGILCWVGASVCLLLSFTTSAQILGINAYIKPAKFFISVAIAAWTFAWMLQYLDRKKAVRSYSIASVILLGIELVIITGQAIRGKTSHFNYTTPLDTLLFNIMGVAIIVYTIWTGYIGYLYLRQKNFSILPGLVWGIRLGIACYVLYALEGGAMAAIDRHTIHGIDGGKGLPFINWNIRQGDLRIAHFMGLHGLQLIPMAGYAFRNKPAIVKLIGISYIVVVGLLLALTILL